MLNRRCFVKTGFQAAAAASFLGKQAMAAPTAPVAVAPCKSYASSELRPTLEKMFDQIGGLGRIVAGKTVAIKINLTGAPTYRLGHDPAELRQWTHYAVIGHSVSLMAKAGARRIRLLESPWNTVEPLEQYMLEGGWNPSDFVNAAGKVECENTNYLGNGRKYSRFTVPNGGHLFKAYDLNHSYEDCDVFVSIAKIKEHATAGITLSMKNCFGNLPCTIYGQGSPKNEPGLKPSGGRSLFHNGDRQPSASAVPENDPKSPREGGYRVTRAVADLCAARPIDLAILDGIESMAGGEGPWIRGSRPCTPGVMVVGTNCVTTDAVATAIMGFDPMADRGVAPFERCDSTLKLGEMHGIGTRDLKRIEVVGTPIANVVYKFRDVPFPS